MHPQAHLNYHFKPRKDFNSTLRDWPTNGPCTVLARCGVRHPAAAGIGHLGRGKTLENLVDVAVSWVGTPSKLT